MIKVIVTTNAKEQREVTSYLYDELKVVYHADVSISVVQTGLTRIDVIHTVNDHKNIAATYQVLVVPISMSYDSLRGFPVSTSFNINRVLLRLDEMKRELIQFVNSRKVISPHKDKERIALEQAAKSLFS